MLLASVITHVFLVPTLLFASKDGQLEERCRYAIFEPHLKVVPLGSNSTFSVRLNIPSSKQYDVELIAEDDRVVVLSSNLIQIAPETSEPITVPFYAGALKSSVYVMQNKSAWKSECSHYESSTETFLLVSVFRMDSLNLLSQILGWLYFSAWTVSFWPQIFLNFKRKSVVGLHFDFLALNATGFLFYSVYNVAMFFIPKVQHEYLNVVKNSVNPVQVQDVAFAIHGFAASALTIVQCFFYERGDQKISRICTSLLAIAWVVAIVGVIVAACDAISWFLYVTLISYTKLIISIVKYVPQVILNYRRKNTEGFSIGAIFLDFAGSMGSMLQMIVIAYNMDEWTQFFGDFTKFGLGIQSLIFDIIFFVQRYALYGAYTPMYNSECSENNQ